MSTTPTLSTDRGTPEDVLLVIEMREYKEGGGGAYLGQQVRYWCEGCDSIHQIGVHRAGQSRYKGGASWEWNGRVDAGAVLSPSQLSRTSRYPADGTEADKAEYERIKREPNCFDRLTAHPKFGHRCHTFIGMNGAPPGHIIFLGDCTNAAFRGRILKLLARSAWPGRWWAKLEEDKSETEYWEVGGKRIRKG